MLTAYYLLTPLFVLLDVAVHLPVRVAGLEEPTHRAAYYAVIFGLGLLCRWQPAVAPWVGMLESAGNLFLLVLSVLLPIWTLPEAVWSGGELTVGLDGPGMVNVVLSGGVLILAFHRHRHAVRRPGGEG